MLKSSLGALLLLKVQLFAQVTFPRNGVYDQRSRTYAFTNATLHTDYQTTLEKATLLIKDGIVEAAGANLQVPNGYVKVDLQGNHIYIPD